jgi:hypothetical protein
MNGKTENDHDCIQNLDGHCKCQICGKVRHAIRDNDDGSFAASAKVATAWSHALREKGALLFGTAGTVIETDFGPEDFNR